MTENTLKNAPDFIESTDAIVKISKAYQLNERDFITVLELLGCATQEQMNNALAILTNFSGEFRS